jgi:RNA polymerase sigma factor (sigma-70 family)
VVNDHGNLITWALRKLHVPVDQRADAYQGGAAGLLNALTRFDPDRGAFRSYAASHVLHEVRMASGMTRRQPVQQVELKDDIEHVRVVYVEDEFEIIERADALAAARRFLSGLTGEDAYIADRLYVDSASQTEIAAELGTYKMAISRRVKVIENQARNDLARFAEAA